MIRRTRLVLIAGPSAAALAAAAYVYTHADRVGDRFLRIGGRIVLKLANRLDIVAALFAATVLAVWLVIAARCAWEAWSERRRGAHVERR